MPQLTIYVPQHLADEIRQHNIPVSATCQGALGRKVRAAERRQLVLERQLHRTSREHPAGNGAGRPAV